MSQRYASFGAVRTRVVDLAPTGAPLVGPDSVIVSDALVQVSVGITVSTGDRFEQKNGVGAICVTIEEQDKITGATVGFEFCHLDAELIGKTTDARVLFDGDEPVGIDLPNQSAPDHDGVSVEVWTQAWDGDERAIYAPTGGLAVFRFVFPRQRFVPGNHTLERGVLRFPVSGKGTSNAQFGDGPGNDIPDAPLTGPYAWFLEDEAGMPAATDGTVALAGS